MYCLYVHNFSTFCLHWFTDVKDPCGQPFKSRVIWKTSAYATQKILLVLTTAELKAVLIFRNYIIGTMWFSI